MTYTSQQITTFADDTTVVTNPIPLKGRPDPQLSTDITEQDTHTVVKIMQRPVLIKNYSLASDVGGELFSINLPDDWLSIATNAVNKLRNFAFLRGNMMIRVMVQSQQFQQGMLMMYYWPYESRSSKHFVDMHNNATSKSGFPHALIDIASAQPVEFEIPYTSFANAFPLTAPGEVEFGKLHFYALSPLRSAAASTCQISVYAYWTDVKVEVPTGAPFVQPSSVYTPDQLVYGNFANNSRHQQGAVPGESNSSVPDKDPIKGTGTFLDDIPIIGDVVKVGTGLIDSVSNIASVAGPALAFLGLSKPLNENCTAVVTKPAPGQSHTTGCTYGEKIAAKHNNAIVPLENPGQTAADEMSFAFIGQRKNFLFTTVLHSTDAPGSKILSLPITACLANRRQGFAPVNVTPSKIVDYWQTTHPSYVSGMFEYYRFDTMNVKFQFVKTAFHSARVRASIHYGAAYNATNLDDNSAYSQIFDLRDSSTFEVSVPWASVMKWKKCQLIDPVDPSIGLPSLDFNYLGMLRLSVLNSLIAPPTVLDACDVQVWVSYSGLQFAVPSIVRHIPYVIKETTTYYDAQTDPDLNDHETDTDMDKVGTHRFAQILADAESETTMDVPPPPMFKMVNSSKEDAAGLCIGESLVSLREMSRRYTTHIDTTLSNTQGYILSPYDPINIPRNSDDEPYFRFSLKKFISALYCYQRGGTKYMISKSAATRAVNIYTFLSDSGIVPSQSGAFNRDTHNWEHYMCMNATSRTCLNDVNFAAEYELPFYCNVPFTTIHDNNTSLSNLTLYRSLCIIPFGPDDNPVTLTISEAAADDWSAHFLLGAPTVYPVPRLGQIFKV